MAVAQQPAVPQVGANGNELVRQTIENELRISEADHSHWMYRQDKQDDQSPRELREVIDTVNGSIYRVLSVNGVPLNTAQQQAEDARIQRYIHDPEAQRKKARSRKEDAQKAKQMLKMLPNAFIYTVTKVSDGVVELSFRPDPNFDPPDRETQVFHSMEGNMVINQREMRMQRLSGRLMEDVTFGWGILGRLQKGGTFVVEQEEVSPGIWLNKTLDVNMHGKAVFFKTIDVQQHEHSSDFRRVPDDLTLEAAAQRLQEETRLAGNTGSGSQAR